MSKKFILFLFILFFSFGRFTLAAPIVNEIMYDLNGSDIDWVEIYNPDSTDVDLTTLKLLISNSTSNHGIAKNSGSQVLHQGDYGVIVVTSQVSSFISKWSSVANVFTSSFSLPNDTAKVEINGGDKTIPISSVTYSSAQGATEDGNSLQLIGGSWTASAPTPGVVNAVSAPSNTDPNNTDTTGSNDSSNNTNTGTNTSSTNNIGSGDVASSSPSSYSKSPQVQKIKVKIIAKNYAFIGIPLSLQADARGYSNEQLYFGKYYWNFGDGDSLEAKDSQSFPHTYMYAGEYPVTLEYSSNYFSDVPDAVAKLTIKVVPMTVSISRVGDANDFFIELTNNTNYEIDISKWVLSAGSYPAEKKFILPKDTAILAKKSMIISPKVSNLSFGDQNTLKLKTLEGKIVFDYGASLVPVVPVVESPDSPLEEYPRVPLVGGGQILHPAPTEVGAPLNEGNNSTTEASPAPAEISADNLPATALESGITTDGKDGASHPYLIIFSIVFIGACAGAVYVIRRKKVIPLEGNDFEILDE